MKAARGNSVTKSELTNFPRFALGRQIIFQFLVGAKPSERMDKKGYGCAVKTGFMLSPETFHVSHFTPATHLKIRICRQMTYLYRQPVYIESNSWVEGSDV